MERLTSVLFSKTKVELLYGGAVHCGLDSQHVQLLLQAGSADINHFSYTPTEVHSEFSCTYIKVSFFKMSNRLNIQHHSNLDTILVKSFC